MRSLVPRRVQSQILLMCPNKRAILQRTVAKDFARFRKTRSVDNRPCGGRRKTKTNPETSAQVCGHVEESTLESLRKVSHETFVSRRSVVQILSRNYFHPYKLRLGHELHGDDIDRRMGYCQ